MENSKIIVTRRGNVDEQTGNLIDESLRGILLKSELATTVIYEELQAGETHDPRVVGTVFRSVCHVFWTNKTPTDPAIEICEAYDLTGLGLQEDAYEEIFAELDARIEDLEEATFEDEEEGGFIEDEGKEASAN